MNLQSLIIGAKKRIRIMIFGNFRYAISQGLRAGRNISVGQGTSFGSEPYLITLQDNVRISGGVSFITHDGSVHTLRQREKYKELQLYGKIIVGENSFIGANATILPNVKIGKNCIVGACSLVTKSVPDDSVVVGIPAKIIGNTWDFAERKIKEMPSDWNSEEFGNNMREYLIININNPT